MSFQAFFSEKSLVKDLKVKSEESLGFSFTKLFPYALKGGFFNRWNPTKIGLGDGKFW